MPDPAPPAVHVVTFDVNVYLDVAELLGPPFTWEKFNDAAAAHANSPLPHPNPAVDSLRALAVTTTGRFAGPIPLEVWSGDHIDGLTYEKAIQPRAAATPEERGLGWTPEDAEGLVQDLIWGLVDRSGGGLCEMPRIPYGNPPLSHEDGMVYRTAADSGDEPCDRFCITNDRLFREADLPGPITVLYPAQWVELVRSSRRLLAARAMRPTES